MNPLMKTDLTEDGATYTVDPDGRTLIELHLPDDVTSFTIPEGTTAIQSDALYAPKLLHLTLPCSLQKVPEGIFARLARNKVPFHLHVAPEHPTMRMEQDCLIVHEAHESLLLASFRDTREMIVPEGVTALGEKAFAGRRFERLLLPQSLRRIHDRAFEESHIGLLSIRSTGTEVLLPSDQQLQNRLLKALNGETCTYDFTRMDQVLCEEYMNLVRFHLLVWRLGTLPHTAALEKRFHLELLRIVPDMIREKQVTLFQKMLALHLLTPQEEDQIFALLVRDQHEASTREMMAMLTATKHHTPSLEDNYAL